MVGRWLRIADFRWPHCAPDRDAARLSAGTSFQLPRPDTTGASLWHLTHLPLPGRDPMKGCRGLVVVSAPQARMKGCQGLEPLACHPTAARRLWSAPILLHAAPEMSSTLFKSAVLRRWPGSLIAPPPLRMRFAVPHPSIRSRVTWDIGGPCAPRSHQRPDSSPETSPGQVMPAVRERVNPPPARHVLLEGFSGPAAVKACCLTAGSEASGPRGRGERARPGGGLAEHAGEDVELGAVLGHRPPRDGDATLP